jgi:hypothetical protein
MRPLNVARALLELTYVDAVGRRGFRALVASAAINCKNSGHDEHGVVRSVISDVDYAITLYVRPVLCLQRSVAITRLLRRRGVQAQLVIGCHLCPFKAHAWVEVSGSIVNDNREDLQFFTVLDRW